MNNYELQVLHAKRRFLTYDQQELIHRCRLRFDEDYLYLTMLSEPYRIHRRTGNMERCHAGAWVDGNRFNEVMTVLDWLCDSRVDRYITGRWINVATHGHSFHSNLQTDVTAPYASYFGQNPAAFAAACEALKGEPMDGGDISYAIELLDGLRLLVQLWNEDEEFPAALRCFWDENTHRYLRYETTWFATGLLLERIKERMQNP